MTEATLVTPFLPVASMNALSRKKRRVTAESIWVLGCLALGTVSQFVANWWSGG